MAASGSAIRAGRAYVELYSENSKLVAGLKAAEKQMQEFGERVAGIGKRIAAYTAIPLIGFGISQKVFSDLDDVLRAVKAVTKASEQQYDTIAKKAKFLGRTTSFTSQQVAESMLIMGRAGFDTTQIDNMIAHAMNLSRATRTSIEDATNILSDTMRQFNLDSSQTENVADILVATANSSAQSLVDLGEAFKYVAPVAKEFRISLSDTAKIVGTLANFGIKGSMAGTATRNIMARMSNEVVQDLYSQIGVPVVDDMGQWRNFADIIQDVGRAVSNLPDDKKMSIFDRLFGLRAIAGGIKLTGKTFEELNRSIDNAAGTAANTAKEMDAGIGGSFRLFYSALRGIGEAVGQVITPFVKKWTDAFTDVMNGIANWVLKNGEFVTSTLKTILTVMTLGTTLIAAGAAIKAASVVISAALSAIWTATNLVTFSVRSLGIAFILMTSPVALLVASLGAIAVVSSNTAKVFSGKLGNAFKTVVGYITDGKEKIIDITKSIMDNMVTLSEFIGYAIGKAAKAVSSIKLTDIIAGIDSVYAKIVGFVSGVVSAVASIVGSAAPLILSALDAIVSYIKQIFSKIGSVVGGVFNVIYSIISNIPNALAYIGKSIFTILVSVFTSSIKFIAKAIYSSIGSVASYLFNYIKNIGSAAFVVVKSLIGIIESLYHPIVMIFKFIATAIPIAVKTVGKIVHELVTSTVGVIKAAIGIAVSIISKTISVITNVFKTLYGIVAAGLKTAFAIVAVVIGKAVAMLKIIVSPIVKIGDAVVRLFSIAFKYIKQYVTNIVNSLFTFGKSVFKFFAAIVSPITDLFKCVFGIAKYIIGGIATIFSCIGSIFKSVVIVISSAFGDLVSASGAAFKFIATTFYKLGDSLTGVVFWIRGAAAKMFDWAGPVFGKVSKYLKQFFSDFRNIIKVVAVLASVAVAFKAVRVAAGMAYSTVSGFVKGIKAFKPLVEPIFIISRAFKSVASAAFKAAAVIGSVFAKAITKSLSIALSVILKAASAFLSVISWIAKCAITIAVATIRVVASSIRIVASSIRIVASSILIVASSIKVVSRLVASGISLIIATVHSSLSLLPKIIASGIKVAFGALIFSLLQMPKIIYGVLSGSFRVISGLVTSGISLITSLVSSLAAVLPEILAIGITAALGALIYSIISEMAKSLASGFIDMGKSAATGMKNVACVVADTSGEIGSLLKVMYTNSVPIVKSLASGMVQSFNNVKSSIAENFKGIIASSVDAFYAIKKAWSVKDFGSIMRLLWAYIKNIWVVGTTSVTDIVYDFTKNNAEQMAELAVVIVNTFQRMWSTLKKGWINLKYVVADVIGSMMASLELILHRMNPKVQAAIISARWENENQSYEEEKRARARGDNNFDRKSWLDRKNKLSDDAINLEVTSKWSAHKGGEKIRNLLKSFGVDNLEKQLQEIDAETNAAVDAAAASIRASIPGMKQWAEKGIADNQHARAASSTELTGAIKNADEAPARVQASKYEYATMKDDDKAKGKALVDNMKKYDSNIDEISRLEEEAKKYEAQKNGVERKKYNEAQKKIQTLGGENESLRPMIESGLKKLEKEKNKDNEDAVKDKKKEIKQLWDDFDKIDKLLREEQKNIKRKELTDEQKKHGLTLEQVHANAKNNIDNLEKEKQNKLDEIMVARQGIAELGEESQKASNKISELAKEYGLGVSDGTDENSDPFFTESDSGVNANDNVTKLQQPSINQDEMQKSSDNIYSSKVTMSGFDIGGLSLPGIKQDEAKKQTSLLSDIKENTGDINNTLEDSYALFTF